MDSASKQASKQTNKHDNVTLQPGNGTPMPTPWTTSKTGASCGAEERQNRLCPARGRPMCSRAPSSVDLWWLMHVWSVVECYRVLTDWLVGCAVDNHTHMCDHAPTGVRHKHLTCDVTTKILSHLLRLTHVVITGLTA